MKRVLLLLTALIILSAVGFAAGGFLPAGREDRLPTIRIDGSTIVEVELAKTAAEKTRGLSGRESLPPQRGLLFIYSTPGRHAIWMKEMNFPIDVVWIGEEGRIVDVETNLTPETFPRIFEPSQPALYILEVNAGFATARQIKPGDQVTGLDF